MAPKPQSRSRRGVEQLDHDDLDRDTIESAMSMLRDQHVPYAVWDAQGRRESMEGTRVRILDDLISWSEAREQPALFWLAGMAGTGKSAIGASFCKKLQATNHLGGSFFCSRTADESDARRIIPTLAYLLTCQIDEFKFALAEQLTNDPGIINKSIRVQLERLICEPLSGLTLPDISRYVLVIDGIDECTDEGAKVDLINSFIDFIPPLPVKILLCSRPEDYIRHQTPLADDKRNRIFRLHELSRREVDPDIALYLRTNLSKIKRLNDTVNDALIARLVDLADGLFVFASTAVEYIRYGNSTQRLRWVAQLDTPELTSVLTKPLDAMYGLILGQAANPEKMESQELDHLRDILAVVLAIRSRLSLCALSELLKEPQEDIRDILSRLHAVINVPEKDSEPGLNILHATFEDFLSDEHRAPPRLVVNVSSGHARLTHGCFAVICSHIPTSTSSYFTSPVPTVSPLPGSSALMYASMQWPYHHAQASGQPYASETEEAVLRVADAFFARFKSSCKVHVEYIDCAIASQRGATDLTPGDHSDFSYRLSKLGDLLRARFKRLGAIMDIDAAIDAYRRAEEPTPDEHPDKPSWLNHLGNSFLSRFERFGNIKDVEASISCNRRAVGFTPDGHPEKPSWLNSLGISLCRRFERLRDIDDVAESISCLRRAVEFIPDGHPDKPSWLNNLGYSLLLRFEHFRDIDDVEASISYFRRAVKLTPDGHPDKPLLLDNLGNSLFRRSGCFGDIKDIEAAISCKRRAVELTPDGHPDKPLLLNNIGNSLLHRFEDFGDIDDLEASIFCYQRAVELTPDGHPDKPSRFNNLAASYNSRLKRYGARSDFDVTLDLFMRAISDQSCRPSTRFSAATACARLCSNYPQFADPEHVLGAHAAVIDTLPQIVWMGQTINRRFMELAHVGEVVARAVSAAIEVGSVDKAFEWFEEGRAIVCEQILRLRTPIEDLRLVNPELATKLESTAAALENAAGKSTESHIAEADGIEQSLEEAAVWHRRQAFEYEDTLRHIRELVGFQNFLHLRRITDLAPAASAGLVVAVNIHETRCDALILLREGSVIHAPLPRCDYKSIGALRSAIASYLSKHGLTWENDVAVTRSVRPCQPRRSTLERTLEYLWTRIVQPVLKCLGESIQKCDNDHIPHITWCPSGPLTFLPLHAAGIYGVQEKATSVLDYAVSSYTPAIYFLLRKHDNYTLSADSNPGGHTVLVSQPATPGYSSIPSTTAEIRAVLKYIPGDVSALQGHEATVEAVLNAMALNASVHLACHGIQDSGDPTKSALVLHDGPLELSTLMQKSLQGAHLAFLSACQTATGDARLPNEVIHLATGMLTVGYRSVVGTMWSIVDQDGPVVAEEFYKRLQEIGAEDGEMEQRSAVAYALHDAVKRLRDEIGEKEFLRWAPFVHFGI